MLDIPIMFMKEDDFICEGVVHYLASIIILTCVAVFTLIVGVSVSYYRFEIKILLFEKLNFHPFDQNLGHGNDYDALLLYHPNDTQWVTDTLLTELENRGFRICVIERDFQLGGFRGEELHETLSKTHRVIVVISNDFIHSSNTITDFYHAYEYCKSMKRNRFLIFIELEENVDMMDHEVFRKYQTTNVFVKRRSSRFWARIAYWLPQPSNYNDVHVLADDTV